MNNAESGNVYLEGVPYGPAAPIHMLTDGFDHDAYTEWMCESLNQHGYNFGTGVCMTFKSRFGLVGGLCQHYQWSADDKAAWLKDKKPPMTWELRDPDYEVTVLRFGQIRWFSAAYPGFRDDMGRPFTFIPIDNTNEPFYFMLEVVDWYLDLSGDAQRAFLIPSWEFDTPQRREINQEFMVTRQAKLYPVMLQKEWEVFAFVMQNLF